VDANKITGRLTIRVASVNGADPQTLTRNGSLQITELSAFPSEYEFSKGVITKYNGNGKNVAIPATIWGEPVKTIGKSAFEGKGLTRVTIPNGVIAIGERAFYGNRLESAFTTIPASVKTIGDGAFSNNLSPYEFNRGVITKYSGSGGNVAIPATLWGEPVNTIGEGAFRSAGLTGVTIPNSVTSIGDDAFFGASLTSVTIPGSVTSIGDSAFLGASLTSVTIQDGVTSIGDSAFSRCRSLRNITILGSVTRIGDEAFLGTSLTNVTIPDSVTSIGKNAFSSNEQFASITIGANVNMEQGETNRQGSNSRGRFHDFVGYYNKNGRKAGTYTSTGRRWSLTPR
jgi:hypothetical protein